MTLLSHLRAPRLDRDAAFDAAVREGSLPTTQQRRCPTCGQSIVPEGSIAVAPDPAPAAPSLHAAPAARPRSVDEELAALGSGRAAG